MESKNWKNKCYKCALCTVQCQIKVKTVNAIQLQDVKDERIK